MNNPFRYNPGPSVREAASEILNLVGDDPDLHEIFNPGKMLGVLLVDAPEEDPLLHHLPDGTAYLAGFSGNAGERNLIEGFVPPVYDLLDPDGYFKQGEAAISRINAEILSILDSDGYKSISERLVNAEKASLEILEEMKTRINGRKKLRDELRESIPPGSPELDILIRESQYDKAQFRRKKIEMTALSEELRAEKRIWDDQISALKQKRSDMSDKLQKWIFEHFLLRNFRGEISSIWNIFKANGSVPPSGTGECAAPKLLQYACLHGMEPLEMGEFWYGMPPEGSVRNHGDFYPSCSGKCGIILPFMLEGLEINEEEPQTTSKLRIVFEDDCFVVVDKPSGMPSVPGLDGRISAYEILSGDYSGLEIVHRLDMDTSGLLLFAKSPEVAVYTRKEFEKRGVKKTYRARLMPPAVYAKPLAQGEKGRISLPLAPDYEDKPRQKVDPIHGKAALTEYEVLGTDPDGSADVLFHPIDGRTHQLRVHSAHRSGLGRPIAGDCLYGGASACQPLQLRAVEIAFKHPESGEEVTISI